MKAGWQTKPLGDVLDIRNGKNQREVESADGEYPIYGSAGNVMGYATSYICKAGTTIVGRKGNINTPIYTETNFWNVDTAFGLEAKAELDSRFLYYFCLSYDFSIHNRGTTIPSLVKSDLLQIRIQFPPLFEQQRIVGILDAAFDGIATAKANAEQNLQNARALFESHLQSVFTRAPLSGVEGCGEGWEKRQLISLCAIFADSAHRTPKYQDDGIPALRPRDVINGKLNLSSAARVSEQEYEIQSKRYKPNAGDIVYSRELSFGWAALLPESPRVCLSQGMCIFRPSPDVDTAYLLYVLNGSFGREQATRVAVGAAHPHINLGDIKSYLIPLPPIDEQKDIVRLLDQLHEETQRLASLYQRKLAALDELKKSLLHQAFSGAL